LIKASSLSYFATCDKRSFIRSSNHWHRHLSGPINFLQSAVTFFFLKENIHSIWKIDINYIYLIAMKNRQKISILSWNIDINYIYLIAMKKRSIILKYTWVIKVIYPF
jgi:hypothetical protein